MKILMAAGGTGGHVFPALTLAEYFKQNVPGVEVSFVGTPSGFENTLVPQAGYKLYALEVEGVKGKGFAQKIKSMLLLPGAFLKANRLLSEYRPSIVFGIGGYVSGPVMLLSSLRGMVTGILEPNAAPGFSNRKLGAWVNRVFVAFEAAKDFFPKDKTVFSGNPIREEILRISPPNFKTERKTILVFGGSQGASKINRAVCEMLPKLAAMKDRISFIHQTGKNDFSSVKQAYAQYGFSADVREFIFDMHQSYAKSHLIIARSGSSVLEIAACARPSILIPYPYAADDHQMANAKVLEKKQAAIVLSDSDCDGERLYGAVARLLSGDELEKMSKQALSLRQDRAAEIIAKELLSLARGAAA